MDRHFIDGPTIVPISHFLNSARKLCPVFRFCIDYVYCLFQGTVQVHGTILADDWLILWWAWSRIRVPGYPNPNISYYSHSGHPQEGAHWSAHFLALPWVLREHLSLRRHPVHSTGSNEATTSVPNQREPFSQSGMPIMPRLMIPRVRSLLCHPTWCPCTSFYEPNRCCVDFLY